MIERYFEPEIKAVWSDQHKFEVMMEVEILVAEGMAEIGQIPASAAKNIREKASFTIDRIKEIEKTTKHDVIAFVSALAEQVGDDGKYIHMGMTSSDVLDTGLSVRLVEAGNLILGRAQALRQAVADQAARHAHTLCMGRTHGVHAEPTTFGLKLAGWVAELDRDIARLETAIADVGVGAISGAVGTYATIDPRVEAYVCDKLGLRVETVSTQIIARDHHLAFLMALGMLATSLERFATELRNLQRTEIAEVREDFSKGQKGSSAMPHKRNPIRSERVSGLARVVRAQIFPAAENVVTWHERDLSQSSVERMIFPDATGLLYYMLGLFTKVVEGLVVDVDRMRENVDMTLGIVFSQQVLLALVEAGWSREDAYARVQKHALGAWDSGQPFKDQLLADDEVTRLLGVARLDAIFDYGFYTKHVDAILDRAGVTQDR